MKVNLHCAFMEVESPSNFFVRQAMTNQTYDFSLTQRRYVIGTYLL
jgi:hypothetical protein